MQRHTKAGFTLIEIIIVVAIVLVIALIVGSSLGEYAKSQTLEGSAQKIASLIETAQSKTLSSVSAREYGVHFASSSVTLFSGDTYSAGDPDNEVHNLDGRLVINVISLGGAADIVFDRLTGSTNDAGFVTVELVATPGVGRVISVEETGSVSVGHL